MPEQGPLLHPDGSSHQGYLLVGFACALQFLVVPGLGDGDLVGKALAALFGVLGLALLGLTRRGAIHVSVGGAFVVLAAAGMGATVPMAAHPGTALLAWGYVLVLVLWCGLVAHVAGGDDSLFDRVIDGLLLAGVVAAGLGLYEHFHYLLLGPSGDMLIPYLLAPDDNARVNGMYGQSNLFALFLTLVLIAFAWRYVHRRPLTSSARSRFLPVFLVALVFALAGSRAASLSLALLCLFLGWLVFRGRYLAGDAAGRRELLLLALTIGAGLLAAHFLDRGGAWLTSGAFVPRATGKLRVAVAQTDDTRLLWWTSCLLIFADHPWLGIGLDNFKLALVPYRMEAKDLLGFIDPLAMDYSKWAHNEWLQLLAEGGLVVLLPLLLLLFLFARGLWRIIRGNLPGEQNPRFLYAHLLLLPFLIQSCLSWPLRHPALLILFFMFVGLLLAHYRTVSLSPPLWTRGLFVGVVLAGLLVAGSLTQAELRLGIFYRNFGTGPAAPEKLAALARVCQNPLIEWRALRTAVPRYTKLAMESPSNEFALGLLPFGKRLVALQEHEMNWMNLALLYHRVGENRQAAVAIQRSIDLRESNGLAWAFQHYLNMLAAAQATGRPLEDFFPNAPGAPYQIPETFRVGH